MDSDKRQDLIETRRRGKTNLKQLRDALGMTQLEFATAIGVTTSPIANCEQGKSELMLSSGSIKKLDALMKSRLGVGVEALPDSLKAISSEHLFAQAR